MLDTVALVGDGDVSGQTVERDPLTPLVVDRQAVTVRNSIYRIQEKPGVDSKQEVVVWAVHNGLVDGEDEPDSQAAR